MSRTLVRLFLVVATAEAISWAGLLMSMYVKYFTDGGERGVQIFGPIHGGVFVIYVVLTLLVARTLRWSIPVILLALACSIPPFATVVFEWWAARSGRLQAPSCERPVIPSSARADAAEAGEVGQVARTQRRTRSTSAS